MSINAAFNGMGHPLPGVAISTLRVIVLFLPLAFLFKAVFGLNGLFIAASISNIALGLLGWFWLGKQIEKIARKYR
jgi:Na+-driven multidrug efflux pump